MLQTTASKKATNVSVNVALLQQAKALNINLSSTLEQALIAKLKQLQAEIWATEKKRQSIRIINILSKTACLAMMRAHFNHGAIYHLRKCQRANQTTLSLFTRDTKQFT